MSEVFELVRRTRGGRILVRNSSGIFKETGLSYNEALELAAGNIDVDLEDGLYSFDEVSEFLNPNFDEPLLETEEIPLDDIEINIPEDTPLLEGTSTSGTAVAAGAEYSDRDWET